MNKDNDNKYVKEWKDMTRKKKKRNKRDEERDNWYKIVLNQHTNGQGESQKSNYHSNTLLAWIICVWERYKHTGRHIREEA